MYADIVSACFFSLALTLWLLDGCGHASMHACQACIHYTNPYILPLLSLSLSVSLYLFVTRYPGNENIANISLRFSWCFEAYTSESHENSKGIFILNCRENIFRQFIEILKRWMLPSLNKNWRTGCPSRLCFVFCNPNSIIIIV